MRGGEGRLHMNVLWEMGGAEEILRGVLEGTKGLVHGVTCGAGMPYKVSQIAAQYGVHYYPIVSSARAFRALWLRSYKTPRNGLAAWSTKIHGVPVATMACQIPKTRLCPKTRSQGCSPSRIHEFGRPE